MIGVAIAVLLAVFLAPIVATPLSGDEAYNSYFSGLMGYERITPLQWFLRYTQAITENQGRFFPGITLLQVTKFTLTHDRFVLKTVNIVAVGVNLLTFAVLATRLRDRRFAAIATIAAISALQIRSFYDPFIEITVDFQDVCELLLLGYLSALAYADRPTPRRLASLALISVVANLTYEITYPFDVVFIGLVFFRGSRPAVRSSAIALGAILAGAVSSNLVLRHLFTVGATSEYAVRPDVPAFLITLFNQTASALPLTYFAADPSHIFGPDRWRTLHAGLAAIVVSVLAAFTIAATSFSRGPLSAIKRRQTLAWFAAACLFVVPGILISLSGRWQHEVKFGLPYQPAYISGFGAALLIALIFTRLMDALPRYQTVATTVVALVSAMTVFITYEANHAICVLAEHSSWEYAGNAIVDAERHGGFGAMPEGSTIFLDTDYPLGDSDAHAGMWAFGYQLFMYTGRRYHVWVRDDPPSDPSAFCADKITNRTCDRAIPNLFAIWVRAQAADESRTVMMQVRQFDLGVEPPSPMAFRGSSALLFETSAAIATGTTTQPAAPGSTYTWSPLIDENDYRLSLGESSCPNVAPPVEGTNRDAELQFGSGFYGQESAQGNTWHWSGRVSTFRVVNMSARRRIVDASLQFQTSVAGVFALWIYDGQRATRLDLSRKFTRFTFRRTLDPGAAATFTLQTNAPRVPTNGDPRDLRFQASGITIHSSCPSDRPRHNRYRANAIRATPS